MQRWLSLLYGKLAASMLAIALVSTGACGQQSGSPEPADDFVLSGPYTHKNLTIFLVHGKDRVEGKDILTLQEALDRKLVVVHETGTVSELQIENLSSDKEIFIQSGDIVRGGRQDRVLTYGLILPPKSGKIPLASFCVEQGRWSGRSGEESSEFASSSHQISGKDLKLAARHKKEQSEVWSKVAENQSKLSTKLGVNVQDNPSPTSLELAYSNTKVKESSEEYVKALASIIDGKDDVIGYAFTINGQVNSADIYASSGLFRKLWPKLLASSATEAIAEHEEGKSFEAPKADAVLSTISDAGKGKASDNDVNRRVNVSTRESEENILFEMRDRERSGMWLHRSYMKK